MNRTSLATAGELPLVCVQWGPIAKELPLVGQTVGEAAAALREPLGLPAEVTALVDGKRARAHQRLRPNEKLEFVRMVGEKG